MVKRGRPSNAERRVARVRATLAVRVCAALSLIGIMVASPLNEAVADTVPPLNTPSTVSADALPTWQVNGVVWSQVVINNIVYATGSFTKARPPGVAPGGAGEISANNIFAYDIRTGNRATKFNHSLNGQGRVVAASIDGARVYVGGDFTTVDGVARGHLASFGTVSGALGHVVPAQRERHRRAISTTSTTVFTLAAISAPSTPLPACDWEPSTRPTGRSWRGLRGQITELCGPWSLLPIGVGSSLAEHSQLSTDRRPTGWAH